MSTLYQLQGVVQRYGDRCVLDVPRLAIDEGDALALIGPSGAGKSTLLRLLCLLETPVSGVLRYRGQDGATVSMAAQREMTLVFQRPLLLDSSVRRNVEFGLRVRRRVDRRLVDETLELLGLAPLAKARATTLSGGEMQRVALARALVLEPRVLLLDEPTANLDPRNVAIMEQAIARLHRRGSTVVIATHNIHQARRLTRRTAMLLNGSLVEVGATEQVLSEAADARTRAFVGGQMVY